MTSILSFILQVHDSVHDLPMKPNYNEPKIYTGGVDVYRWSKLTKKQQTEALKKDWYIYFSFRDPNTGYLKQQKRMKASANSYSTKKQRLQILQPLLFHLINILDAGYNPYLEDNSHVKAILTGKPVVKQVENLEVTTPIVRKQVVENTPLILKEDEAIITLEDAKKIVLDTKEKVLNNNSFPKFRSRINQFYRWLYENDYKETDSIEAVNKKTVIQYLNTVLQKTSPRNRNNSRTDLGSFIETLVDNDVLQTNFVKKIKKLTAKAKRNKSYNSEQLNDIKIYMKENDPILSLFVDFVCYGFLRPMEVCRLKVGDLNFKDMKMQVQAKNKAVKEKIIPEILFDKLPDLSALPKSYDLFNLWKIGGIWDVTEASKRDYFTKRFKKVKDHFGLNEDYGLYSFRHTTTSELYRELSKEPNMSPNAAKSKLMLITGHSSMTALESYLRDIDAELPEDFSHFLN
ncbi:site-specific integrase [Bizionia argentinensis JUB59]|uniref:Site-specific integrase n=1 Tax=Bizionia argentinensis JUB59 TaxID=1046627 RepID=G2EDE9_9FLAO|nr:integrase [Bizionia argentinensis]EGV43450.2 site-specific integrase [Bizionia argentinensis JUB59]